MSKESESFLVTKFDNPDERARPHHLFLPWYQMALLGGRPPHEVFDFVVNSFKKHRAYKPEYYDDSIGVTQNDARRFRKSASAYMSRVVGLSDEAWLKLSMDKDGICNGCAVGNHCNAENYIRDDGRLFSNTRSEDRDIETITEVLEQRGFMLGRDYARRSEQQRVLNLNGRRLSDTSSVVVETRHASAMIVQMGPIRTIIREGRLKPRF